MNQNSYFWEHLKFFIVLLSIPVWLNAGASCARANAAEPKIKIAIIDSGYDESLVLGPKLKLCKTGHFNFATGKPEVGSSNIHGSQVASIIAKELQNINYCAIIYNVMPTNPDKNNLIPTEYVVSAFYKASFEKLAAINASYSGTIQSVAEREAVKDSSQHVDKIFVAAGNNSMNLDFECLAFPACFEIKNMYPVGAFNADGTSRLRQSNYGSRIKLWFNGTFGESVGTSYAAPRALSAYILELNQTLSQ